MINSFKNPVIMRILRTTERHGAGWREQNFIPNNETRRELTAIYCGANVKNVLYIVQNKKEV